MAKVAMTATKKGMKSGRKIRIGFVGVGGMGQCADLKNYVTVPDCEVVAIAELRQELAAKVAAKYGVPRIYADHKEMLAKEELDGIVASQPFQRHGVLVPELLKAGIPVFTEKPLAGALEVGEKILKAVKGEIKPLCEAAEALEDLKVAREYIRLLKGV